MPSGGSFKLGAIAVPSASPKLTRKVTRGSTTLIYLSKRNISRRAAIIEKHEMLRIPPIPLLFCMGFCEAQVSVLTWHNDNARSGQNLKETVLAPSNVNASTFGKLFTITVDGKVDAQPLYVASLAIRGEGFHNVLYVVTEHDSAYAFDADTGTQLWRESMLGANETSSDARGCSQIVPEIGITSTPVIDLQIGPHGTMYLVAMSKSASGTYHQRLHALDITTGAE